MAVWLSWVNDWQLQLGPVSICHTTSPLHMQLRLEYDLYDYATDRLHDQAAACPQVH